MGCTSSRVDASCEEAAMINGDFKLLYDNYEVTAVYSQLKQKAVEGKVSLKNFKSIARHLPLIYHKNEEVIGFYSQFLKDDHFDLKFLATLSAILAKGPTSSKVEVLYEIWAKNNGMSRHEFESMLDFMFDLAIEHLPRLASKPEPSNNYTAESFNYFLERARAGRHQCKEALVKELFTSEAVQKAEVLRWAQTGENSSWLSARFIRANLKKAGKRLLHRKKKQDKSKGGEVSASLEISGAGVSMTVSEDHHHHEHHEHHDHHHEGEVKLDVHAS